MPNANTGIPLGPPPPPPAPPPPAPLAPPARMTVGARLRKTAMFAALLGAFGALLGSAHIPCGFAFIFHMPCPGCGSTRAMLALAHGDVASYVRFNPLAAFMSAIIGVLVVSALHSLLTTGTFGAMARGRVGTLLARGAVVVGVFEVIVWIARFAGFLGGPVPI